MWVTLCRARSTEESHLSIIVGVFAVFIYQGCLLTFILRVVDFDESLGFSVCVLCQKLRYVFPLSSRAAHLVVGMSSTALSLSEIDSH